MHLALGGGLEIHAFWSIFAAPDCEMSEGNVRCRYYAIAAPSMVEPVGEVVVFALLEAYSPGAARAGDLLGVYILRVWIVEEELSSPLCR